MAVCAALSADTGDRDIFDCPVGDFRYGLRGFPKILRTSSNWNKKKALQNILYPEGQKNKASDDNMRAMVRFRV